MVSVAINEIDGNAWTVKRECGAHHCQTMEAKMTNMIATANGSSSMVEFEYTSISREYASLLQTIGIGSSNLSELCRLRRPLVRRFELMFFVLGNRKHERCDGLFQTEHA